MESGPGSPFGMHWAAAPGTSLVLLSWVSVECVTQVGKLGGVTQVEGKKRREQMLACGRQSFSPSRNCLAHTAISQVWNQPGWDSRSLHPRSFAALLKDPHKQQLPTCLLEQQQGTFFASGMFLESDLYVFYAIFYAPFPSALEHKPTLSGARQELTEDLRK